MVRTAQLVIAPAEDRRAFQGRQLRLAFASSFVSKSAGLALQFAMVPAAVRLVGPEGLGVLLTVTSIVAWVGVASVGFGPGLTREITRSVAVGDETTERSVFWSAMTVIAIISLALGIGLTVTFLLIPIEGLTGVTEGERATDVRMALVVVGLIGAAQLLFGTVDAARLGYQESHTSNYWATGATVVSLIWLLVVGVRGGTVTSLVIALNLPGIVARAGNLFALLRSRVQLQPATARIDRAITGRLVGTGAGFLMIAFSSFLTQHAGLVLVAQSLGPLPVASSGVMLRAMTMAAAVVTMMTLPLWPALTDAASRKDHEWASILSRRNSCRFDGLLNLRRSNPADGR